MDLETLNKRLQSMLNIEKVLYSTYLNRREERKKIERQIELLNQEQSKRDGRSHIKIVTDNFKAMAEYKCEFITKRNRRESYESRERRLSELKNNFDRKVEMEIKYSQDEQKYFVVIKRNERILETWIFPKWQKDEIRHRLDSETRPIFPWKFINSGQAWSVEAELSLYYLDESYIPNNLIQLNDQSISRLPHCQPRNAGNLANTDLQQAVRK